ncbi:MAG TPA: hypothetical protein VGF99_01565 [Myxococcota bacterium]
MFVALLVGLLAADPAVADPAIDDVVSEAIVFDAVASTACRYDAGTARYTCDDTRDIAVVVDTTTSAVPAGVRVRATLRSSAQCLLPGVDVEVTSSIDGRDGVAADPSGTSLVDTTAKPVSAPPSIDGVVVVDAAGLALSLDGRAVVPSIAAPPPSWSVPRDRPLAFRIDAAPKPSSPCLNARDVVVVVPVVVAGTTTPVQVRLDVRRDPQRLQIAARHTPEPALSTSTAPVPPPGYDGGVPAPDETPHLVAIAVGATVGVAAGVGVVLGVDAALPGFYNGSLPAMVLPVVILGVVGGWAGHALVPPQPHPQAEAFAAYELARAAHDDEVERTAPQRRQHEAWTRLRAEANAPTSSGATP